MNRLSILFFLCFSLTLTGQIPYFKSHPFTTEYTNIIINTIHESQGGFIYFGTSAGLFQYDGLTFDPISINDSLPTPSFTAIFEDKDKRLWTGTKEGDIFFINEKKMLEQWIPESGTFIVEISGFVQTMDGIFWIATYGEGLYYVLNGRMFNIDEDDGLSALDIYSIARHRENHVLIGTDAGINVCKIKDGQKKIVQLSTNDGLSDEIVKTILSDQNGNFWAGTYDKGIDYWESNTQSFHNLTPGWTHGEITHLELFQQKELWIGTNGNGLFRFDLKSKSLEEIKTERFQNSKIFDLHKDIEGNLWVVNNSAGISSANRQFEFVNNELGNIQAVLTDKSNRTWLGTPEGLFLIKNEIGQDTEYQPYRLGQDINVISLFEDRYGHIWVGTFGQGLYCFNPDQKKRRRFTSDQGLLNENVLSIAGSDKNIWLATLGGVFEVDALENVFTQPIQFRNYNHNDGLGTDFIYKAFLDSKNRTWFGTDGKGLSMLENGNISNYFEANGVPLKAVYAITEDLQGHIWFSTAEHGIFEFDGKKFAHLNVKEGIRDLEITGMATDDLGNIIMVHPSGVDILNPQTKHLIYYDEEVGLHDIEPVLNAVHKDANGNIYLGAKNRLIKYSPLKEKLEIHPRSLIKNVNIFFEPLDFRNTTQLAHDQNSLVFDYIGLWYSDPHKVTYRYKLEGYNLDWIYSKDQQANFSNLASGDYTFRLSSTENGVFESEPEASYHFTIKTPFWQKAWFIGLCILLALCMIYYWSKWKTQRLQLEADIQKEKVESQLEVLKSQINPHFLFNSFNTLISLIEEEPEAATEYVERLSDFYRNLLQYRTKDLIPLQEELELLRNFNFLLKKRFGDNIHLEIPEVNGNPVFIPPLTLQMLIENAIKHNVISKAKPLHISLTIENDSIVVKNNLQKKMTREPSTRFGLQSIRSRYALFNLDKVKVEENENEFKVTIPIIEKS